MILTPVSYTHLDVYKRQEEEQPSRHDMPAFPSGKAEGEGRSQRRQHAPVREPDGPGPVEAPLPRCRRLILGGGEIRPLPGKGDVYKRQVCTQA